MKVIEGNFNGKKGTIMAEAFTGDIMRIAGNKLKFPDDFDTIKLINKDEKRPSILLLLLLAITLIGIPIAILVALLWKDVTANVAFKLVKGEKFLASCNGNEWKVVQKYCGKGELKNALDSI